MSYTSKLDDTGKSLRFRFVGRGRAAKLVLHPADEPLPAGQKFATDPWIRVWLNEQVVAGRGEPEEIEAIIDERITDVAKAEPEYDVTSDMMVREKRTRS